LKDINFSDIPVLSGLDRINLARLIPNFEEVEVKSGKIIFQEGEPGDSLYIIIDGMARVFLNGGGGLSTEIASLGRGECFGEMALLTGRPRSADIEAMTDLILLRLPKDRFDQLIKKHPSLGVNFAGLLANRLSQTDAVVNRSSALAIEQRLPIAQAAVQSSAVPVSQPIPSFLDLKFLKEKRFWGLLFATALCLLSFLFLRTTGLKQSHILLIELLLAASILWSLGIFSYHAVSLGLAVLAVLFGATSPEKALSGFSSSSWFLVLGVFAISAAISKTGLLYRLVLLVIKHFPPSYIGQTLGLAISGLLLTPVIPSPNGRLILVSPLVLNLSEIVGFKKGNPGSVGMAMVCLLGFGHMSFMFMNGAATCFLVLGLLPAEVGASITWGYWLKVAFPLGMFFFFCSYLVIVIFYRPREIRKLNPLVIEAQLRTLGPLTAHEKISLATVVVSLMGFLTQSWHEINGAWVAMLCFLILYAGSVLDQRNVRSDIDWNFLISFGALLGFGNVIASSGLSGIIANGVKPYLEIFAGSHLIFFWVISVAVLALRFILPLPPALLVTIISVIPVSSTLHIHPMIIGLVILASANPWFLTYQNWMYQNILENTEGKLFSHEQTLRLAFAHVLIVMAAVAISIPYWEWIRLVP